MKAFLTVPAQQRRKAVLLKVVALMCNFFCPMVNVKLCVAGEVCGLGSSVPESSSRDSEGTRGREG